MQFAAGGAGGGGGDGPFVHVPDFSVAVQTAGKSLPGQHFASTGVELEYLCVRAHVFHAAGPRTAKDEGFEPQARAAGAHVSSNAAWCTTDWLGARASGALRRA